MSHEATNWAIKQRGLKPAAKLVLWHLCDRYHPDNGCFPAQETLANDCEISRSGLNIHLDELELRGLIRRESRFETATKRQKSTIYRFAFEAGFEAGIERKKGCETGSEIGAETCESRVQNLDTGPAKAVSNFGQKPCPKNSESRVQNLDTNPVREPVREEPVNLRESAGEDGQEETSGQETDGQETGETADADTHRAETIKGTGRSAFKAAHAAWPTFTTDSTPEAEKAWFALQPDERLKAAIDAQRYVKAALATGRKLVCSFGVYLKEKRWEKLPAEAAPSAAALAARDATYAAPFGPVWQALRFHRLKAGAAPLPPMTTIEAGIVEGGGHGAAFVLEKRLKRSFPAVAHMDAEAACGRGVTLPGDWMAALGQEAKGFEPVPVGTPVWQAWKQEFEQRKWPWLPNMGSMAVAYFPAQAPASGLPLKGGAENSDCLANGEGR